MPIELNDFALETLQDRGSVDVNVYLDYTQGKSGTYSVDRIGYFIAQGPQKTAPENTLSLYYMIETNFMIDGNPDYWANGSGFVMFTDSDGPSLIPFWFEQTNGTYSSIPQSKFQSIMDFFTLITTDDWTGFSMEGFTQEDSERISNMDEDAGERISESVEEAQPNISDNFHDPIEYPNLFYAEEPIYDSENVAFVQISMVNTSDVTVQGYEKYEYTVIKGVKDPDGNMIESSGIFKRSYNRENIQESLDVANSALASLQAQYVEAEEAAIAAEEAAIAEAAAAEEQAKKDERNETVEEEDIVEVWDKNTRWLLTNNDSPITRLEGPNGAYYWLDDGNVLELEDNDISQNQSGSLYFKVPEFMEFDLRLTTSSNGFNDKLAGIFPQEWVNPNGDTVAEIDDTEVEYFGSNSPGGNKIFRIPMTAGDKLSVDIDAEDPLVTQFRLVIGGDEYVVDSDQDETIDDEVYINISNPTIRYTRQTTTITDGFGEIVEVKEEKISPLFDTEQLRQERDAADDARERKAAQEVSWGWIIGIGAVVVIGGLLLYRLFTRPPVPRVVASAPSVEVGA